VSGLGNKLIDVVERATERIVEAPERYAVLRSEPRARRLVVEDFPFSVVYALVDDDTIFVVAVAHQRRRPRYWGRRLDDTPQAF
jgi:plasmid stabilization system protein ParE